MPKTRTDYGRSSVPGSLLLAQRVSESVGFVRRARILAGAPDGLGQGPPLRRPVSASYLTRPRPTGTARDSSRSMPLVGRGKPLVAARSTARRCERELLREPPQTGRQAPSHGDEPRAAVLSPNGAPGWDRSGDVWFAAYRTSTLNTVTVFGRDALPQRGAGGGRSGAVGCSRLSPRFCRGARGQRRPCRRSRQGRPSGSYSARSNGNAHVRCAALTRSG